VTIRALTAVIAAALLAPAAALANEPAPTPADRQNAASSCKALQTSLGAATFKETYGTNASKSNAYGQCVAKMARAEAENRQEAQTACAAERGKAPGAFGRCIAAKRAQASAEDRRDVQNAARRCQAERRTLGAAAFATKYGTRANAFGRCVSKLAQGSDG